MVGIQVTRKSCWHRGGRQPGKLLIELIVVVVLVLAVSSCGLLRREPTYPDSSVDHSQVREYLEQNPGVPLVLPVTLPDGYRFIGPGLDTFDDSRPARQVIGRTADFTNGGTVAESDTKVVELCTSRPGSDACTIDRNDLVFRKVMGDYAVSIRFVGESAVPAEDSAKWSDVKTAFYSNDIKWID